MTIAVDWDVKHQTKQTKVCFNSLSPGQFCMKMQMGLCYTLLQQGISEPIFYGDLVYKFKRIVGKPSFSD